MYSNYVSFLLCNSLKCYFRVTYISTQSFFKITVNRTNLLRFLLLYTPIYSRLSCFSFYRWQSINDYINRRESTLDILANDWRDSVFHVHISFDYKIMTQLKEKEKKRIRLAEDSLFVSTILTERKKNPLSLRM